MTNSKNTKKALFSSVIALILCCSMLIGTTFAWFTDEVNSGVNQIIAGNLDVDVLTADGNSIEGVQTLFNSEDGKPIKWEPGVVAYENLTVVNKGNLALKYQLSVNFDNATKTPAGKTLAEALKVAVLDEVDTALSREELIASIEEDEWQDLASFVESGKLLPKDYTGPAVADAAEETKTYGIVIWWEPTDHDNDFNMNNENQGKVLSIDLGINLVATQLVAENDSFDNKYDAGAWVETMTVSTEAELVTALNAAIGENILITLENDIVLTGTWTPIGNKDAGEYFTGTLDGNGHTISGLNVAANDYDALISAAKDATIKNLTVEGTVNGVNAAGIVARIEGETVVENCVSNVAVTGTTKAGGIVCNVTNSGKTVIANCVNNGNVNGGNNGIGGIVGYINSDAYLEIINCTNNGNVTSDNNKYAGAAVGYANLNAIGGVVAGMTNTGTITGTTAGPDSIGERYLSIDNYVALGYCRPANWTVAKTINTADELVSAFANLTAGDVLYITADLDMTGKTVTPVTGNKGFTMLGGGHTISNLSSTAAGLFVNNSGSSSYTFDSVVLENCSVDSTTNYGALFVGDADTSDDITITNCHVKNCTVVSAKYAAAFVGYTAGYNVQNNGPVYSDVTITDCSVTGGSITGGGSVGAAIGHSGGNDDTTNTITNLKVEGVAINGEDAEHTGIVVGTAHIGDTIINNATYSNVTGNCNGLYGRFVPGTTGTLVIDGAAVLPAATTEALKNAIDSGKTELYLPAGNYTLPGVSNGDVTISGNEDTVITVTTPAFPGSNVTLNGVTIAAQGTYTGIQHVNTVTYNDATINGEMCLYGEKVVFNNCTFNLAAGQYLRVYGAEEAEFNNCTFNTAGKAILIYKDGGKIDNKVTVKDCTFNATAGDKAGAIANQNCAAIEIDNYESNITLICEGNNIVDSDFSGLWRIKTLYANGNTVTVDGVSYNQIAIDGKLMTIDASKNVTVQG